MKTKFKIIFFLLSLFVVKVSFSQEAMAYDQFITDSLKIVSPKLLRPQLRIDSRVSLFEGQAIHIYGYDAGIMARDKLRLALGYYRINNDLPIEKEVSGRKVNTNLVISCGSINTELIYLNRRYYSLGFPLEFAFGEFKLSDVTAEERIPVDEKQGYLGFANFGLSLTFKPLRAAGLKGMIGYRKSLYPNEREFNFNGIFSSIGFSLDFQEIFRSVKMYKLKKKYYGENFRRFETFVDLLAD